MPSCNSAAMGTWPQRSAAIARLRALVLCIATAAACACGAAGPPAAPPVARDPRVRIVQAQTEPLEQEMLAKAAGVRSDHVELAVAFPPGFDPGRPHPIL